MKKITELITLEQSYKAQAEALKADHQARIVDLHKTSEQEVQAIQAKLEDKESIIAKEVSQKIAKQTKAPSQTGTTLDTKKARTVVLDLLNQ